MAARPRLAGGARTLPVADRVRGVARRHGGHRQCDAHGARRVSHALLTSDDPAYYQLADIFSYALRRRGLDRVSRRRGGLSGDWRVRGGRRSGPELHRRGRSRARPADEAGLLIGDEIVSAMAGRFAQSTPFVARSARGAALDPPHRRRDADHDRCTPTEIHPNECFFAASKPAPASSPAGKRPHRLRARLVVRRRQVSGGAGGAHRRRSAGGDADALDLGSPRRMGGAQPGYLDLFNSRAPTMQVTARNGETGKGRVKWRKPVATLINGGTQRGRRCPPTGSRNTGSANSSASAAKARCSRRTRS